MRLPHGGRRRGSARIGRGTKGATDREEVTAIVRHCCFGLLSWDFVEQRDEAADSRLAHEPGAVCFGFLDLAPTPPCAIGARILGDERELGVVVRGQVEALAQRGGGLPDSREQHARCLSEGRAQQAREHTAWDECTHRLIGGEHKRGAERGGDEAATCLPFGWALAPSANTRAPPRKRDLSLSATL
ncbi:hypothetical protein T492DRAFT_835700 [Pavlovales sp. CCMP2436]|nr:hypothetical protein T492DRAFT_835700 [Pavlovales sp. CCMP2436]